MISKVVDNPKYTRRTNDSNIKFEEGRVAFILKNPERKEVIAIRTDCEELRKIEKCDYVAEVSNKAFYIELKGSDVKKALMQLRATVKLFMDRHANTEKIGAVVHTRHPRVDTSMQILELSLVREGVRVIKGAYRLSEEV